MKGLKIKVHLDKTSPLVKTDAQSLKYQTLWMPKELNHHHHEDPSEFEHAFDHVLKNSFISAEGVYFTHNPGYHSITEDKYGNEPHGYLFIDDVCYNKLNM